MAKLFFISAERGWHGGEEQLRLVVSAASAAGHVCHVAARTGERFAQYVKSAGLPLLELPSHVRSLRAIWAVRRALRDIQPDVVHANDPHALWIQRFATWGMRVPARVAARRVLFSIRSPRRYRYGCDRVICVSHAIADVCRVSGLPAETLRVIHDGTDPLRMSCGDARRGRATLALADDVPLILCVAQLADYKGHQFLIDAVPPVLKAHPRTIFALAGDGPLRGSLMAQARSLGVESAVRFLGYRYDVPDLIQACDVFVLPSTHEGLGSSVLDAMFAARPVVAANAGGIPEMLRDAQGELCGWLPAAGDASALARELVECLSSPQECSRRVALALTWAHEHFAAARMIRETLDLYDELRANPDRRVLAHVA
jgi:glycosyltransferase involved in cell wall biosynthesis